MRILRGQNFYDPNPVHLERTAELFIEFKAINGYYGQFLSFDKPNNILLVWWEEELD